jgi:hypothetical protein
VSGVIVVARARRVLIPMLDCARVRGRRRERARPRMPMSRPFVTGTLPVRATRIVRYEGNAGVLPAAQTVTSTR